MAQERGCIPTREQTIEIPSTAEMRDASDNGSPDYESPLETPLPTYPFPMALPQYTPQPPEQAFISPWTSHSSLEKPDYVSSTTISQNAPDEPLDEDGFTATERREHQRSLRHLRSVRAVAVSRLAIRFLSVLVSGAAFVFILVVILSFARYHKSHQDLLDPSDPDEKTHINFSPTTFFASISSIFTVVSLSINVLCCLIPKLRKITPLSNVVFCIISVVGMAGWLTGCLFLEHGRSGGAYGGKANFWYFVCDAAEGYAREGGTSSALNQSSELTRFCNYTSNSWDLGILQLCFEILTFINVVIAWFMIRAGMLRAVRR